MIHAQTTFTLVNQQNGNLAFKLFSFEDNSCFDHIQRHNYFSLVWIMAGTGKVRADFAEYSFKGNSLLAFSPYQPYMLFDTKNIKGVVIHFHSDFFCILKHHKEVSCNGMLFNNIYNPPITSIDKDSAVKLQLLVEQIKAEMQNPEIGRAHV